MKYNILIPHKNDPKRLKRCLDSIPQREDLRVIVVDDNSDPNIVDFDNFPGNDRKDVKIIFDKIGGGAGHARNIGLKYVNAEKLINADADDFFTYCFNDVLDEYADDDSDIVFLNACSIEEGTYLNADRSAYQNKIIKGYLEGDRKYYELILRYDHGSPCSKIFKKSLIDENNICFEEVPMHDDTAFCYLTGHYAKKIKVDKRAIYCISYSPTSISFTLTDEKYITRMHVIGKRDQFIKSLGIDLQSHGKFLEKSLTDIYSSGNYKLYEKCLKILEKYGFSSVLMNDKIKNNIKDKKEKEKRIRRNSFIKRILNYCHII